LEIA
jgi:chromosome segregation ATPase